MAFTVIRPEDRAFQPPKRGDQRRRIAPLSQALTHTRANLWRLPPGARGGRHVEHTQEEMFVVLEGTLTMLLGEPPERVDVAAGGLVAVHQDTALQVRNETDEELVLFIYGAPPVTGKAEFLDDVEL